jgi:hypothetical protein
MARIRLTDPRRMASGRMAVEDNTPYPGTVNQPDRKFKRRDEYDIDWETVNHPYPDMRHEWKDDARDEIGFGIPEGSPPKIAAVRVAATKAVRAAVLLLGEKVEDDVIEAQARDFMAMGAESLDRTLQRFADSQSLYVADEDEDDEGEGEGDDEGDKRGGGTGPKQDGTGPHGQGNGPGKGKADGSGLKKESSVKSKKAQDEDDEDKDEDEDEDEVKEASKSRKSEDEDEDEDEDEVKEASKSRKSEDEDEDEDDDKDGDKDEEAKKASKKPARRSSTDLDIELNSASGMDLPEDESSDPRLAQLWEDSSIPRKGAEVEPKKARKKVGIKELGGQPRAMAASQGADDIGSIWETAPDVSSVFR